MQKKDDWDIKNNSEFKTKDPSVKEIKSRNKNIEYIFQKIFYKSYTYNLNLVLDNTNQVKEQIRMVNFTLVDTLGLDISKKFENFPYPITFLKKIENCKINVIEFIVNFKLNITSFIAKNSSFRFKIDLSEQIKDHNSVI
jgi:hypothetical protein